jgi:hypothetical protein
MFYRSMQAEEGAPPPLQRDSGPCQSPYQLPRQFLPAAAATSSNLLPRQDDRLLSKILQNQCTEDNRPGQEDVENSSPDGYAARGALARARARGIRYCRGAFRNEAGLAPLSLSCRRKPTTSMATSGFSDQTAQSGGRPRAEVCGGPAPTMARWQQPPQPQSELGGLPGALGGYEVEELRDGLDRDLPCCRPTRRRQYSSGSAASEEITRTS